MNFAIYNLFFEISEVAKAKRLNVPHHWVFNTTAKINVFQNTFQNTVSDTRTKPQFKVYFMFLRKIFDLIINLSGIIWIKDVL